MSASPSVLQVFVPYSEEETRALFARHRLPIDVQVGGHAFPDPNSVLLQQIVTLIIAGPIAAFFAAFGAGAGKDAYQKLKAFLSDARAARRDQLVLLEDSTDRLAIVLSDELPDEALRALFEVDLKDFAGRGTIGWDPDARRWLPGWAPKRRSDVKGWIARKEADPRPPTWHLSTDLAARPAKPLCGADLGPTPIVDENAFRSTMAGPPCWDCFGIAGQAQAERRALP